MKPQFYVCQTETFILLTIGGRQCYADTISIPLRYYHSDHLGSASWITNDSGTPVQHLQHMPYGEPFVNERTFSYNERFTFTGKERDSETSFSYFGARYYDSDLMIAWLSVDPMADKYPGVSPYAYCAWNPVRLVDPNGEDFKVVINERKKTMTITANIILYTKSSIMGKNELENSAKYYRQSINAWFKDKNGESWTYNHKGKTYSIDFNVNIIVDTQAKNKSRRHYNGINNYIDINPDDGFRSIVYNSKFGTWAKAISKQNSARHEFGHLLYLSDRYDNDKNSEKGYVPHKGWEGNVMGERYGEVQQRNITEALDKYFKRNEEK